MSEAVAEVLSRLSHLSQQERAELAYALLLSLEPEENGPDAACESELTRRVNEIREGRARGIPAEQWFAALRSKSRLHS
jgi:putative addiction module component (TIGR02574 family)